MLWIIFFYIFLLYTVTIQGFVVSKFEYSNTFLNKLDETALRSNPVEQCDEGSTEESSSLIENSEHSEKKLKDHENPMRDSAEVLVGEDGPAENMDSPATTSEKILALLVLASSTGRGEFATSAQTENAKNLIIELENANPTAHPTSSPLSQGTWELVYSDTQLFRSSPFFMAGRAVCSTPEQAEQYDWFCDMHRGALAISQIGAVRQIVSSSRLVSEFEVKAGAVPFLSDFTPFSYSGGWPVAIEGAIVSSADITPTGDAWEIFMDTVAIKGSNLPGLRQALDSGLQLQSRQLSKVLEENISAYSVPKPIFKTTYLTEALRISRDQDGKVFVYTKTSESIEPTDYSSVMPDLGISKLIEGFNDSVTKFYI